jgi:hypothetical protein
MDSIDYDWAKTVISIPKKEFIIITIASAAV